VKVNINDMNEMKCWLSLAAFAKFLPAHDGNLFYYDSTNSEGKNDKPVIVLVHGLGDEADTWRHVFHPLADADFRVLALDLPGFGRSNLKCGINIGVHCKAVMRIMEVAGVDSEHPAVLVGSSLGAGIVELVAGSQPNFVKAVILLTGSFPFAKSINRKLLFVGLPFFGRKWYRGFRKNHDAARKSLRLYYADIDVMDEADRDFLNERVVARVESDNQERGYLSTVRSINVFGLRAVVRKMKRFPGRILILCGEKDKIFPPEKSWLFRTIRPDAELAVIPNVGHLPHQEKPEATVMEIMRFLKS